jgi:hypothetical protein
MEKFLRSITVHVRLVSRATREIIDPLTNKLILIAGIVKYMRAQVGPSSKDIMTVKAFEEYLKAQEGTIFGFFEKDSDLKGVFTKYADSQREKLRFGHSSDPDVLAKAGEK